MSRRPVPGHRPAAELARRSAPVAVRVVVPARDEERLLPRCLDSVSVAVERLRAAYPGTSVGVTVVADRCTDATVARAGSRPAAEAVDVVEVDAGRVGTARHVGVRHALASMPPHDVDLAWLASTDADCVVPPHWLVAQVMLARAGFDLVVGTVRPEPVDLPPDLWQAWRLRHRSVEGHPHVHGANLGISARAYRAAGGFPGVALHEDVLLVEAVRRAGQRWCATAATEVTTSARRRGRLTGGFADYLAALDRTGLPRTAEAAGPATPQVSRAS